MSNILFEIGDWSSDGHGFSAEFIVQTNKTLEELQEIHFKENEFIGSLCSEYEDDAVYVSKLYDFLAEKTSPEKAKEILQQFIKEADTEVLIENDEEVEEMSFEESDYHTFHMYDAEAMLHMWLLVLKAIDSSLTYKIISPAMSPYYVKYKGYPVKPDGTMHFYGHDKKGRHMKTPGYGIWDGNGDEEFCHSC